MSDYFPFDPNPQAPAVPPPPLSCDSQFHVYGSPDVYPIRPGAAYEMSSATWQAARRMHEKLGIERGVIVQATTYGADHSVVLDALKALNGDGPRKYLACANAAVLLERDDAYLQVLHDAGVRGARFSRGGLGVTFNPKQLDRAFGRLRELGWYVKVQPERQGFNEQLKTYANLDIPVLIDHMGRADPSLGAADPALCSLLSLLDRGNYWVMLSLGEKLSRTGAPWDDMVAVAQAFIDRAPNRCVWATDWPHPLSTKPPANDGALLELLYRYTPDPTTRQRVLVDNPAKLFGFDDGAATP
ncbi:amidohydrolase family protein [Achromobacter aloeverae]